MVFFDEFDKLVAAGSDAREAYQYGTQHGFLTLLDGIFDGSGIDPGGLLFVFAGAFPRLGEIVESRLHSKESRRPVGFMHRYDVASTASHSADLISCATAEDFVHYGIEAELIGRIPVLAPILPLIEDELVRILTMSEGSVCSQYTTFFEQLGVTFTLSSEAALLLAHEAHASGSGARGLRKAIRTAAERLTFCYAVTNPAANTRELSICRRRLYAALTFLANECNP